MTNVFWYCIGTKETEHERIRLYLPTDAFDHDLMLACLKDIREGKKTNVPVYDFITNARYVFEVSK